MKSWSLTKVSSNIIPEVPLHLICLEKLPKCLLRSTSLINDDVGEKPNPLGQKEKYSFPEMWVTRKIFIWAAANLFLMNLIEFLHKCFFKENYS